MVYLMRFNRCGVTFVDADDDIDDEMAPSGTRTSQMRNRQRRLGPTG
jgi:hypothetical protein